MAGVRLILKYQWKAHWRRFMRAGQVTQLDMLLLLLFGALFIYKLPAGCVARLARVGDRPDRPHGATVLPASHRLVPNECTELWRELFTRASFLIGLLIG